jgi:DNA (cytosine-5)-methyltransferase 1
MVRALQEGDGAERDEEESGVKLRVFSVFAGIGGFDLGFQRTGGFETVAVCEIEPFQRALLRQHWPEAVQYHDIHTVDRVECDVICGGFPCQKFSTASRGRRVAADLWPEMYRVVSLNEPTYVVAENVSEDAIRTAADQLASIGYGVTVRNISGSECGAPHVRSRWWLIAHPHEEGEFQRTLNAEVAKLPELCAGLWGPEAYASAIRVSDGIPHRVHRVEALGNAVLPQIPQVIGQAILKISVA